MAAHLFTALKNFKNQYNEEDINDTTWEILRSALDFSCWTEDLELEDYLELDNIVKTRNTHQLMMFLDEQLPVAQETWERLGKPKTRRDWQDALYNEYLLRKAL